MRADGSCSRLLEMNSTGLKGLIGSSVLSPAPQRGYFQDIPWSCFPVQGLWLLCRVEDRSSGPEGPPTASLDQLREDIRSQEDSDGSRVQNMALGGGTSSLSGITAQQYLGDGQRRTKGVSIWTATRPRHS